MPVVLYFLHLFPVEVYLLFIPLKSDPRDWDEFLCLWHFLKILQKRTQRSVLESTMYLVSFISNSSLGGGGGDLEVSVFIRGSVYREVIVVFNMCSGSKKT